MINDRLYLYCKSCEVMFDSLCSVDRSATFIANNLSIECPSHHRHTYDTRDFVYADGSHPRRGTMATNEMDPRDVMRIKRVVFAIGVSVIVILFIAAFAACGSQGPSRGTVLDKRYHQASEHYVAGVDIPGSCSMVGKIESCSPGIHTPGYWQNDPQWWELKIRSDDGKRTGWRGVDETTFHRCNVGAECDTSQ